MTIGAATPTASRNLAATFHLSGAGDSKHYSAPLPSPRPVTHMPGVSLMEV